MKIVDEISYEISYRSHMFEICIMNSYENYMRSHIRSLLVSITISYEISYNIFTWVNNIIYCLLSVYNFNTSKIMYYSIIIYKVLYI